MGLILDTHFIIVAEREAKRGLTITTDRFPAIRAQEIFHITFTEAGELVCAQSASPIRDGERLCHPYPILPWSRDISWQHGPNLPWTCRLSTTDRRTFLKCISFSLWISATVPADYFDPVAVSITLIHARRACDRLRDHFPMAQAER